MKTISPFLKRYFDASNRQDVHGMLAAFDADALVRDDGEEHKGTSAIRHWMEEVVRKYNAQTRPLRAEEVEGGTVVNVSVSGNFPGSPVTLDYRFQLRGEAITCLEIA